MAASQRPNANQPHAKPRDPTRPRQLGDCPILYDALASFVRAHNHFESSVPYEQTLQGIRESTSLQDAMRIPLRNQLFTMTGALSWVFFLRVGPRPEDGWADPEPFDANLALELVAQVYDLGVRELVFEHFADPTPEAASDTTETEEPEYYSLDVGGREAGAPAALVGLASGPPR